MSNTSTFEGIPLADATDSRWSSILENCDPLLHTVTLVGISAVKNGAEQAQNDKALQVLASGELVDSSGAVNEDLVREISGNNYPRPDHLNLAVGGLCIVSTAVHVSRLFRTQAAIDRDYLGQTDVAFTKRGVSAITSSLNQSIQLGESMGISPVRNVQAQVYKPTDETDDMPRRTELSLAARLYASDAASMSVKLVTRVDIARQETSATISGGTREGDFVHADPDPNFGDLMHYTQLIANFSQHSD